MIEKAPCSKGGPPPGEATDSSIKTRIWLVGCCLSCLCVLTGLLVNASHPEPMAPSNAVLNPRLQAQGSPQSIPSFALPGIDINRRAPDQIIASVCYVPEEAGWSVRRVGKAIVDRWRLMFER